MDKNGRHEYKFHINKCDYYILRSKLNAFMTKDPHADKNGRYFIRSLYFDNDFDKALTEKMDGLDNRDKYRIRVYNFSDKIIHLEMKSKKNGICFKRSASITRNECDCIINGEIKWLENSNNKLLRELYFDMTIGRMQPKTIVDYEREVYIYDPGNVRVTFDMNIRSGIFSKDIFNKDLPTVAINYEPYIVLEIKFDDFLPSHIRDILQLDRRPVTNSKYALCRMFG